MLWNTETKIPIIVDKNFIINKINDFNNNSDNRFRIKHTDTGTTAYPCLLVELHRDATTLEIKQHDSLEGELFCCRTGFASTDKVFYTVIITSTYFKPDNINYVQDIDTFINKCNEYIIEYKLRKMAENLGLPEDGIYIITNEPTDEEKLLELLKKMSPSEVVDSVKCGGPSSSGDGNFIMGVALGSALGFGS